jgi:hypothetical protein
MSKNIIQPLLYAVAIVVASYILGYAFMHRNQTEKKISVVGLGKTDFTSDLIVWEGNFSTLSQDIKDAYAKLNHDKSLVEKYLIKKGIDPKEIVFSAVETHNRTKANYSPDGRYLGEIFVGYELTQTVTVKSKNVETVEKVGREITELLNEGVKFYSEPPRYYYTKLEDLKLEMISRATENAKKRAEKIAENSGASLGKLINARMGVFQITGQYSDENYSWGGTFNTSSKEKTASITMKLTYGIK